MAEPILVRHEKTLLRIPAGYLAPWPRPAARGSINERKRFAFSFWMPDRRYVEIDETYFAGHRPMENGRNPPTEDAFVVKVKIAGGLGGRSPETRFFQDLLAGRPSSFFFKEELGLMRFWQNDSPSTQVEYRQLEGTEPQILLRCPATGEVLVDANLHALGSCEGGVYFASEGLKFRVSFPRQNLANWRAIVETVRELFNTWKSAQ